MSDEQNDEDIQSRLQRLRDTVFPREGSLVQCSCEHCVMWRALTTSSGQILKLLSDGVPPEQAWMIVMRTMSDQALLTALDLSDMDKNGVGEAIHEALERAAAERPPPQEH